MPTININMARFYYETSGPGARTIFTPGGFAGVYTVENMVGRVAHEHAIIGWDRRNCGQSDLIFDDSENEWFAWAADLAAFTRCVCQPPVVLGGYSSGTLVSLLCAAAHPELVKGLILIQITSDILEDWKMIARERYLKSAEAAETGGMQAVTLYKSGWFIDWPGLLAANPRNRGLLLSQDPGQFARIMRRWAAWHDTGKAHTGGLDAKALSRIKAKTLIIPGTNEDHPLHTARWLHEHIPGSQFIVLQERFPDLSEEAFKRAYEDEIGNFLAHI